MRKKNKKDLAILYEVTGYRGGCRTDENFWHNYKDFYELGEDSDFIKIDKVKTRALSTR